MLRQIVTRPALRSVPATVAGRSSSAFSTSSSARAAGGDHHHHEESGHGAEAETNESFLNPIWRNTFILVGLAMVAYPFLPSPPSSASSPSTDPSYTQASSKSEPFLTRQLRSWTTPSDVWAERNAKHLELTIKAAEDKLLFQEAERPKVHRLRNPAAFDAGSPFNIAVGSQVDLSDLKVKSEQ